MSVIRVSGVPYLQLVKNYVREPSAHAALLRAELEQLIDASRHLRRFPDDQQLFVRDKAVRTLLRPGYLEERLGKYGDRFDLAYSIKWPILNGYTLLWRANRNLVSMTILDVETGEERQMEVAEPLSADNRSDATVFLREEERCLQLLPDEQRELVYLRWQGWSYKEIVDHRGGEEEAVRQMGHRLLGDIPEGKWLKKYRPFRECVRRCRDAAPEGLRGGKRHG